MIIRLWRTYRAAKRQIERSFSKKSKEMMDSRTSQEIIDIFHELHAQGNTIVLITHDPDMAKQAQRSVHILDGKTSEVRL